MTEYWRDLLKSKDSSVRKHDGVLWKFLNVKKEKDGIKGTVSMGECFDSKCVLTVFKSGTILLARSKGSPFEVVKEFASRVLIPITKE